MAAQLNPYISFDGNARQAMEFYQGVFGGELMLRTYGEHGLAGTPEADKIMHGTLETTHGHVLMGADTPPGTSLTPGDNITVCLSGDEPALLRGYWERLCEGGTVSVPLEKQMWGDEYGACMDRFGINWMVNITHPRD